MKQTVSEQKQAPGPSTIWDVHNDYVRVILKNMTVEARVGLHPWEMHPERPNRLIINVELFSHYTGEEHFINYDGLHKAIAGWPSRPHTRLLETLVDEVVNLCFAIDKVEACKVSILKPDIFNDTEAVGIEVYRCRR